MIYPKWIQKGSTIGIIAPSDGITDSYNQKRLDFAIQEIEKRGYHVIESPSVRKSHKGKSATNKTQAKELEDFFKKKEISSMIACAGGDFLLEILPEINWDILIHHPKWLQGYSDITSLLYILTTKYDMASIYASNIKNFGMKNWHQSLKDNLSILEGNLIVQTNFAFYEKENSTLLIGNEEYHLDTKVKYNILTNDTNINVSGRIIGGCIDCLLSLCGTKWDATLKFIEKYKQDGLIWYFDNAELTLENLIRGLWQLKEAGWFQYVKCFLFGRFSKEQSFYKISKQEAILRVLKDYQVPIITDMDFGHVPPRITIINGSLATIQIQDNHMKFQMEEK